MKTILKDERDLLSPPGETIIDILEVAKMTQVELAERLGKTPSKVSDIIMGKEPITTNTALKLEKVLGLNAQFWLNREMLYREKLSRIEQEENLMASLDWVKAHPIKLLKKYGYLSSEKTDTKTANELLHFYGVASPVQWQKLYINEFAITNFRKSKAYQIASASMAAWLRIGEVEFKSLDLPLYNKNAFKKALITIRSLVYNFPNDYALQLKEICAAAGVAIIYTVNLPKAPISGATRWIGGNPLIQLTDRYKSNDKFWFTFFHEAGHVLLHGKKEIYLERDLKNQSELQKEGEANSFAEKCLLPANFPVTFPAPISENDVINLATKYNTHPAIIVSRLQHLKVVPHSFGARLKEKISLEHLIKVGGNPTVA